jgi:hypothetical protein
VSNRLRIRSGGGRAGNRVRTDDLLITNQLLRSVGQTPLQSSYDFGSAIRDDRLDSHLLGFIHVIGHEVQAD